MGPRRGTWSRRAWRPRGAGSRSPTTVSTRLPPHAASAPPRRCAARSCARGTSHRPTTAAGSGATPRCRSERGDVMATTTGIVLFDGAEELDFAGPWEVFTMGRQEGDTVVTIAEPDRPLTCAKGMRVLADHTFADAPALDVVLVPGGRGRKVEAKNP